LPNGPEIGIAFSGPPSGPGVQIQPFGWRGDRAKKKALGLL